MKTLKSDVIQHKSDVIYVKVDGMQMIYRPKAAPKSVSNPEYFA